jgi:phosphoribosylglycinamide formyltransferase-1
LIVLGVLVSGNGSNLQAILDAIQRGKLDARVGVVISNKALAGGLERAARAEVPAVVIDHRVHADREAFDQALVDALRAHGVEWVVLAGFMRIVTPVLLSAFPMRVVNVHPALLPSFPGVDAQKQALEHGVRVSGCTVHLVDRGTDTGPIVAQRAVPVLEGDNLESLKARILGAEHELLPEVLQWIAEGRMTVDFGVDRPRVKLGTPAFP